MPGDLRLFSERTGQYIDALYAVLVAADDMQFFPEMLEAFGKESVVRFLDIFAGQTVVVPTRPMLEMKIRDVTLWMEVSKNGEKAIPQLAKEFEMTEDQVRLRVQATRDCMDKVGVSCKSVKSAESNSAA